MASYEKAVTVENSLATEFHHYITGTAVISDGVHGSIVALYRTPDQPTFACPKIREGVKVVIKTTPTRLKRR